MTFRNVIVLFCALLLAFCSAGAFAAGEWVIDERWCMTEGESIQLSDAKLREAVPNGTTYWASQNPGIAQVNVHGVVKARDVDVWSTTIVTATRGGEGMAFEIIVSPKVDRIAIYAGKEPVESLSLVYDISEIGTTLQLSAVIEPADALGGVLWKTDNARVATVDALGNVEIVGQGDCTLTAAAADDSGYMVKLYIIVTDTAKHPYYLEVDKGNQVVRVYECGVYGGRPKLVRRMICSTGAKDQMVGDDLYTINGQHREWSGTILPGVYVRYTTRIFGQILFHSLPYDGQHQDRMDVDAYAQLGTQASHGCIRLLSADSKWVYENVHSGSYMVCAKCERDESEYAAVAAPALAGTWDPTDDSEQNPDYNAEYTSLVN